MLVFGIKSPLLTFSNNYCDVLWFCDKINMIIFKLVSFIVTSTSDKDNNNCVRMGSNKLWGGCFTQSTDSILEQLNSSINVDKRMYAEDIQGSKVYAEALQQINLLTETEMKAICDGLDKIKREWDQNSFIIKPGDEDIHTANERRLKEIIGEPAAKLHVGRSRNDQVITDMKLWLKANLTQLEEVIKDLIKTIVSRAYEEIDILMPGYTHLQRAQPVRWSHYLMSYVWSLKNDCDRLQEVIKIINTLPLGSGALAGNPFPIDRNFLAQRLNFGSVTPNSMQAVADRDFIAQFLFWASLVGIHLSRLAEDLIIYSSKEFGFVKIDDSYSTGSSLMPQKRNPDSLELIRGIGGGLFGNCCSFMMVLKSLPSTYNKDLQCDKETMFATFDKLVAIIEVANGTIGTLKINEEVCQNALNSDMLATDLAYYLVQKGVPFREAHHLAGKVVATAEEKQVLMTDLTLDTLQSIHPLFDVDVQKVWHYENSVEQYVSIGGTAKSSILKQIQDIRGWLD